MGRWAGYINASMVVKREEEMITAEEKHQGEKHVRRQSKAGEGRFVRGSECIEKRSVSVETSNSHQLTIHQQNTFLR